MKTKRFFISVKHSCAPCNNLTATYVSRTGTSAHYHRCYAQSPRKQTADATRLLAENKGWNECLEGFLRGRKQWKVMNWRRRGSLWVSGWWRTSANSARSWLQRVVGAARRRYQSTYRKLSINSLLADAEARLYSVDTVNSLCLNPEAKAAANLSQWWVGRRRLNGAARPVNWSSRGHGWAAGTHGNQLQRQRQPL